MSLLVDLYNQIKTTFNEHPHRFFTEHDIHSELALIATTLLKNKGKLYAKTSEGLIVNRIHHEYPTPFRCRMKGSQFRAITEDEFKAEKLKKPKMRARRGWIDLVIFNSEYISSNKLSVISGKRYRDFRDSLKKKQRITLDLAVEVVFYPTFDKKPHIEIMKRKVSSTIQDYKKLVALMEFTYPDNTPFCKEAAMMFFSNTSYRNKLEKMLQKRIPLNRKVTFFPILCPRRHPQYPV